VKETASLRDCEVLSRFGLREKQKSRSGEWGFLFVGFVDGTGVNVPTQAKTGLEWATRRQSRASIVVQHCHPQPQADHDPEDVTS
jgi:hypothetical protein